MGKSPGTPLTPAALAEARDRAGLSVAELASLAGCRTQDVENWEAGRERVPARVSELVRYAVAMEDRARLLERSGLPPCDEAAHLEALVAGADGDHRAVLEHVRALTAHAERCATCRARTEYLERHAPPVPELPRSLGLGFIGAALSVADRLPAPLRPPDGVRGEGRRVGLGMASALSMYVAVLFAVFIVLGALNGTLGGQWRQMLVLVPAVTVAYFVAFYLAGGVFDLTYPIRHRFSGYVARGALGAGLVYGVVGLVLPLIDAKYNLRGVAPVALVMAIIGAVAGAVLWVKDRVSGKLNRD